jgi:hypothetical protein
MLNRQINLALNWPSAIAVKGLSEWKSRRLNSGWHAYGS